LGKARWFLAASALSAAGCQPLSRHLVYPVPARLNPNEFRTSQNPTYRAPAGMQCAVGKQDLMTNLLGQLLFFLFLLKVVFLKAHPGERTTSSSPREVVIKYYIVF
jgi:hypothetical protein